MCAQRLGSQGRSEDSVALESVLVAVAGGSGGGLHSMRSTVNVMRINVFMVRLVAKSILIVNNYFQANARVIGQV